IVRRIEIDADAIVVGLAIAPGQPRDDRPLLRAVDRDVDVVAVVRDLDQRALARELAVVRKLLGEFVVAPDRRPVVQPAVDRPPPVRRAGRRSAGACGRAPEPCLRPRRSAAASADVIAVAIGVVQLLYGGGVSASLAAPDPSDSAEAAVPAHEDRAPARPARR